VAGLRADELFTCLDRHGVQYVLIGGLAAVLHGSPLPTLDADICPARTPENLVRLAAALREIDARLRTSDTPAGVRFPHDAAFLGQVELLNLVTAVGDIDLSFTPAGTHGFDDLDRHALPMTIRGITIRVAALEDIIRSKAAANRPKDQRSLPTLRLLLDELRKRHQRDEVP
jgi:hypothetical protein